MAHGLSSSAEHALLAQNSPLLLTNANGTQVELNELALHNWLVDTLTTPDVTGKEELLSQFGLQNSTQVLTFLKTSAGETVRELVREELIKIVEQEDNLSRQISQEQAEQQRLLAYLLLKLAHKEDEKFKKLCDEAQLQIDKILANNQKTNNANYDDPVQLLALLESIGKLEYELNRALEAKTTELTKVENKLTEIVADRQSTTQHFDDLTTILTDFDGLNRDLASYDDDLSQQAMFPDHTHHFHQADAKISQIIQAIEKHRSREAAPILSQSHQLRQQLNNLKVTFDTAARQNYPIASDTGDVGFVKDNSFVQPINQNRPINFRDLALEILAIQRSAQENKKAHLNFFDVLHANTMHKRNDLINDVKDLKDSQQKLQAMKAQVTAQLHKANEPNAKPALGSSINQPQSFFSSKKTAPTEQEPSTSIYNLNPYSITPKWFSSH
ncbi:Uncharacterised protein [Legionella beliardensis]|uniref:LidA long coiled-coil domain-containing protein n=1 Tax=Legionella beliardensis TaxID=91822 RepID=A0A378I1U1_9GAMM|nr:hypothetical protein [Legionella beliardensis]STX28606.1 Uncharacterised protein [Legionella beliardensis]